jgi:hypothetical protein
MEHRGIHYDVKMGAGHNVWIWTVHTPNPKQGTVQGRRERAVAAAEKAINNWCSQRQAECGPSDKTAARAKSASVGGHRPSRHIERQRPE